MSVTPIVLFSPGELDAHDKSLSDYAQDEATAIYTADYARLLAIARCMHEAHALLVDFQNPADAFPSQDWWKRFDALLSQVRAPEEPHE